MKLLITFLGVYIILLSLTVYVGKTVSIVTSEKPDILEPEYTEYRKHCIRCTKWIILHAIVIPTVLTYLIWLWS